MLNMHVAHTRSLGRLFGLANFPCLGLAACGTEHFILQQFFFFLKGGGGGVGGGVFFLTCIPLDRISVYISVKGRRSVVGTVASLFFI